MKKSVLVLMSTYNGKKYVLEQIDSILDHYSKVSILIRDDGSMDDTIDLIEEHYNGDNVKIIKGKNIGASRSYFELISLAPLDYDYYAFSDQDDIWIPQKLERAVKCLDEVEKRRPSLYYCGQIITDEKLNLLYEHKMERRRSAYANFIFNQMAGCTSVFNREMMILLQKHIPQDVFGHDAWTYRLCAALGGNIIVDENMYILYRQHENNVVGLSNSLLSKIKRAITYIFVYKPSRYAREILFFYGNDMSSEMYDFLKVIECVNSNKFEREKLINNYNIIYFNRYLDIIFRIKIIFKQM